MRRSFQEVGVQGQFEEAVVRVDRIGEVAVLVLARPPVNALSEAVRRGLEAGLRAALADPKVAAIVIRGEGRGFSAGADISEFGKTRQGLGPGLGLGDLCLAIEAARKPVIAALHGPALGGGLELALAAHYRIASDKAVLGLPEVSLGLLPGAGGTQRLPRLIGGKDALRMMVSGVPVSAAEALALGLVDQVVTTDLTEAALAMAGRGLPPRPTGEMRRGLQDGRGFMAAVAEARSAQAGNRLPAAARIVDCVEAALLFPMAQGLLTEEDAFRELVATPEAAGLRHAFFTERRAVKLPPAAADLGVKSLTTLGIWGLGEGVFDLTSQALTSGLRVVLASQEHRPLVGALETIAGWQEIAVSAGRMTAAARDADWARLATVSSLDGLEGLDLILVTQGAPAVPPGLNGGIWAAVGPAGQGAAQAITVAAKAGGLAELGLTGEAGPEAVARLVALARRLTWRLVTVGPGGPIETGLLLALAGALDCLESEGISPEETSEVLGDWSQTKARTADGLALVARGNRVVALCLAAMAAEGARMLEDGRARRPLEVDAVAMLSGLVPRWRGGPMFQADQRGLLVLRRDLMSLADRSVVFRTPDLIDRMIANGKTFAQLNAVKI